MSETTPVDRTTAARINPFICSCSTSDTLGIIQGAIEEIGCLLTSADSPQPDKLWPVFAAMSAALAYEQDHMTIPRRYQENCHV